MYPVDIVCPVCLHRFTTLDVEVSLYTPENTDTDFCVNYKDISPVAYEPVLCQRCGYSNLHANFDKVTKADKDLQQKCYINKFTDEPGRNPFELTAYYKRMYAFLGMLGMEGERDDNSGVEAFKLLRENLAMRNASLLLQGKAAHHMGWLYRKMGDPLEIGALEDAADFYGRAYKEESLEEADMDPITCLYLVGELNRRAGNADVSMEWFEMALNAANSAGDKEMAAKIRQQMKQ